MKRRSAIQSILGLPAAAALPLPMPAQTATPAAPSPFPAAAPDAVGDGQPGLFSPDQLAALQQLCQILVPSSGGKPSAVDAGVPLFLDFLLSQSSSPHKDLYTGGLDRLNADSSSRFQKPFASTSASEAEELLAPIKTQWTYEGPQDQFARFLTTARQEILQATLNSREWSQAGSSRRAAGLNYYWRTLE